MKGVATRFALLLLLLGSPIPVSGQTSNRYRKTSKSVFEISAPSRTLADRKQTQPTESGAVVERNSNTTLQSATPVTADLAQADELLVPAEPISLADLPPPKESTLALGESGATASSDPAAHVVDLTTPPKTSEADLAVRTIAPLGLAASRAEIRLSDIGTGKQVALQDNEGGTEPRIEKEPPIESGPRIRSLPQPKSRPKPIIRTAQMHGGSGRLRFASAQSGLEWQAPSQDAIFNIPTGPAEVEAVDYLRLSPFELVVADNLLPEPNKHALTLQDCILGALEFAPEISILHAETMILNEEVAKQRAAFDWNSFLNTNWDEANRPVATALDGATGRTESHTLAGSYGVNRLNRLGGTFRIAQDMGITDSNSTFFSPNNQATTTVGLEYNQPLLQGAGRKIACSRIQIAVAQYQASDADLLAGIQDHVLSVIDAFWNLAARRAELRIQRQQLQNALETQSFIGQRTEIDVGPVQVSRTAAAVSQRQANVVDSEYAVRLAQNELLRLIYGQGIKDKAVLEVITLTTGLPDVQGVSLLAETESALSLRPELKSTLKQISVAAIERGIAKNQLLPALQLSLAMSNQGLRGNRAVASALNDQFDFIDPTYGIGIEYQLPILNRSAKANLRQAEWRLISFQRQLEQTVGDVVLSVQNAVQNLELQRRQIDVRRQALDTAIREFEVLRQRTDFLLDGDKIGALYVDTLLSAQDRLATAQQSYATAFTSYARAIYQLKKANGSLLTASADL
ncbi:MAG: TolC family protein [Aureliella sp.]